MTLKGKLDRGEFAVLAEMEPPKGVDTAPMVANARRVKDRVAGFVVPEMNQAVMRMSALGGAVAMAREGLEAVMQVCCRDRNRIALQGDLLAAAACGIKNVLVVGGEDPSYGDHHQARSVHDIGLHELLEAIAGLCRGRDMAGIELAGSPDFLVGSTTLAGARGRSLELEIEEMGRRARAGARFFITPPIFDREALGPLRRKTAAEGLHIIPTVLLLKSVGMARYIERNLAHIAVAPALIERLQAAPDKAREGVRIAGETAAAMREAGFAGVMLSTLGWEHKLPEIVEALWA
jgi:5,10-methylenetetrahydrofolate reductase